MGDSFDHALAETVKGYYKPELIYGPAHTRPWKIVEHVELATLAWVHLHNTTRLHGYLNDVPPTEFEARFYCGRRFTLPLTNQPSISEGVGFTFLGLVKYSFRVAPLI